jgi:hypothetical protein
MSASTSTKPTPPAPSGPCPWKGLTNCTVSYMGTHASALRKMTAHASRGSCWPPVLGEDEEQKRIGKTCCSYCPACGVECHGFEACAEHDKLFHPGNKNVS